MYSESKLKLQQPSFPFIPLFFQINANIFYDIYIKKNYYSFLRQMQIEYKYYMFFCY